jgi:hypothetical protein
MLVRKGLIKRGAVLSVAALTCAGMAAAPAGAATIVRSGAAAPMTLHVVAIGLDQPHGVAIGPSGGIYVSDVGNAKVGPGCKMGTEPACVNQSGAIVKIVRGVPKTIGSDLPSLGNPGGGDSSAGIVGLKVIGRYVYGVIQNSNINATTGLETYGEAGSLLGDLVRVPKGGGPVTMIASLGPYEAAHNPDHGRGTGGQEPPIDSDPYGIAAYHGGIAVADAAGNDILFVNKAGKISTLAVLPLVKEPMGHGKFAMAQAVPTSLAVGPGGELYIGELGGAAANDVRDVNVYRLVPGVGLKVFAKHLTMVGGIAFDHAGRLLVLEIDTAGINDPSKGLPAPGALIRINKNKTRTVLAKKGLEFPLGLAVARNGAIYISNYGVLPAKGGPIPGLSGELVKLS